jgi:hypothetical protein
MFVVTFALGAIVLVVAIVALFKKKSGDGGGSLEFGGFKLAGTGAPTVFLLTGVVLMLSGVNGYAAIEKNRSLKSTNETLLADKSSLSDSVATARSDLQVERTRTRLLLTRIPPQALQSLQVQHRALFTPSVLQNIAPATPGGSVH